jgi:hypothetical protein
VSAGGALLLRRSASCAAAEELRRRPSSGHARAIGKTGGIGRCAVPRSVGFEGNITMRNTMIAGATALAVAAAANAAFVGFEVVTTTNGTLNKNVLYARFNGPTDTVLNAFHLNRVAGSTMPVFHHNDFLTNCVDSVASGSWNPQFVCAPGAFDSYVCIGGGEGFASGNSTNTDPDWGQAGFNQAQIPFLGAPGNTTNGPGWFNSNPPNLQGRVDGTGRVKLGQFVLGAADGPIDLFLKVGYNTGQAGTVQFAEGTFTLNFIPAPGALAALAAAGLLRRRRR